MLMLRLLIVIIKILFLLNKNIKQTNDIYIKTRIYEKRVF